MKNLLSKLSKYSLIISLLFLYSCTNEPVPFELGVDVCEHCKMTIVDPKWGGEIITNTGKVIKFDVVECLILYKNENGINSDKIESMWTVDYLNPNIFVKAEDAVYALSIEFNSPMGLNAVSVKNGHDLKKIEVKKDLEKINWTQLQDMVQKEFSKE